MSVLRRALWTLGAPARAALVVSIRAYQLALGGWLGGQCRFEPSCSHYALAAIRSRGAVAGLGFALWRILRCNPFGRGGLDPAPDVYDSAIRQRSKTLVPR
jgi:hypothetical protein